ncbi:fiery mountain [Carabus blaptoides fortunei]
MWDLQNETYITDMFWKHNNASSPHFEAVLQKEGVTLQELMEEDDIIQECKTQNKKLVDFLCQRNVLEELVTLITEEPSDEYDERSRFKYPNIACELLTCDVPALNESLSRDNELLEKLYSFIDKDPPLNPLLASFLSRTLGVLIVKRLDQAMGFLKDKENFISLLLKHLGTSAIMDLTLKLITEVGDVNNRQNLLNWLDSQRLVQSLIALFDPKVDTERHHNASQLLCDVLRISRDALNDHRERMDTDPILARLESPETVSLLLDQMLGEEKSESSIVGGIQVLLALLGHKNSFNDNLAYNNAYDETEMERKQKIAESTAVVILGRLKDFHQILLDPPRKTAVRTSIGTLDPPLGNTRLQVTKLLAALIAVDNSELLCELMNLGTVEVLLDLFFKYVWNNFLHAQVQQCIANALRVHVKPKEADDESSDNMMHPYLIIKCHLLGRILDAWDDNEQKQRKPKGIRQGYMGHLINIANEIVQQCKQNTSLDTFISENLDKDTLESWNNFIISSLAETNKTQSIILGGIHPSNLTSDDNSEDYNIPYPQAAMLQQQIYNDFQMQQMSPDLIENYGFQNDNFINTEDPLSIPLERRSNINMLNDTDMSNTPAEMFKKVCSEYINTLEDADDTIFEEQDPIASRTVKSSVDNTWDPRENCEEEEDPLATDTRMDVDPWAEGSKTATNLSESKDPWANLDSANGGSTDGWADFGSFTTQFDTPKPSSTVEFPATSNSAAATSVTSTTDLQSAGDQKMDSPGKTETTVQGSEPVTEKTSTDNQCTVSVPSDVPANTTTAPEPESSTTTEELGTTSSVTDASPVTSCDDAPSAAASESSDSV